MYDGLMFYGRSIDEVFKEPIHGVQCVKRNLIRDLYCHIASIEYREPNSFRTSKSVQINCYSGAKAFEDAFYKVAVRYAVDSYRPKIMGMRADHYKELADDFVDPREFVPLTNEQLKENGLMNFSKDLFLDWTVGKKMDGRKVMVPADLVFCHNNSLAESKYIYSTNSIGVAANYDRSQAKRHAFEQLVRSHNVLKSWLTNKKPIEINFWTLPSRVQDWLEYWKCRRYDVRVLYFESEYFPTYMVVISEYGKPNFVVGASAALNKDLEEIILEAFGKAHIKTYYYDYIQARRIQNIKTADQHGALYMKSKKYSKTCAEYLSANQSVNYEDLEVRQTKYDLDQLMQKLNAVIVDYDIKRFADLSIVRILSPNLIPLSFGYGMLHVTHSALGLSPEEIEHKQWGIHFLVE